MGHCPTRQLRSSSAHLFSKPAVTSTFVLRTFSVSIVTVQNSIKPDVRSVDSLDSFKFQLKSTLFFAAYGSLKQHDPEPFSTSDSQLVCYQSALHIRYRIVFIVLEILVMIIVNFNSTGCGQQVTFQMCLCDFQVWNVTLPLCCTASTQSVIRSSDPFGVIFVIRTQRRLLY